MTQTAIAQTPLFNLHKELGGKMVPFAGYMMPVQYPDGIIKEHLHTRSSAGLFDVSHMGQIIVRGAGVALALEKLVPVDLSNLKINQQTYAVFTNENGGIMDDLIITKWDESTFFLVVNAACKEQDLAHLCEHLDSFKIEYLTDQALIALQGPKAIDVLVALNSDVSNLTFMNGCHTKIENIECYVTRSGYTGEDGFEISVSQENAEKIARVLLKSDMVKTIGLGARDSLRLEAGLCLYGHDMDINTTPVQASLLWSISKSRRADGERSGGFLGADQILFEIKGGTSSKRVGFLVSGKAPVREGAQIIDDKGNVIGKITSGGFAPSLNVPVALGYVDTEFAAVGTKLNALVRGKPRAITISKTPFVPQNYFRG